MKNYFLVLLILPFLSISITSCKDETVRNKKKDKDLQQLNVLFQEIETIANQVTCEEAADWKFIFVDGDVCSASTSTHVAYSTKIDQISTFIENRCVQRTAKSVCCEVGNPISLSRYNEG